MLNKILKFITFAFLFLLPWQTRWIYGSATLNNLPWEYGTLSFYGTEILLWLIVILTGVRIFIDKNFWQNTFSRERFAKRWPLLLVGVALFLMTLRFAVVSPAHDVSMQFITRLIGTLCLMICLAISEVAFDKLTLVFWSGAVVQGVLAIVQFFTQSVFASKWLGLAAHSAWDTGAAVVQTGSERWLRAYGSFGWPNSLGVYLAVAIIIGLFVYANIDKKFRPLILAGELIIFAGLLFTFSRGALLALVAGFVVYILIGMFKKIKVSAAVKQGIAIVIFGAILSYIFFSLIYGRVSSGNYLEQLSLNERQMQYAQASQMFLAAPYFGVGPGLYTYALAANYTASSYGTYQPVHNIYFLALTEIGAILFICLCVFLVRLAAMIWRVRPLYLSVIAVLLVAGLFDHFLWSLYAGQILFWVVWGMGLRRS